MILLEFLWTTKSAFFFVVVFLEVTKFDNLRSANTFYAYKISVTLMITPILYVTDVFIIR